MNKCQDGGSMCTDCDAQGGCWIETSPSDLEEDKHSTSGMGWTLVYAVSAVSLVAAVVLAAA